MSEALSGCFSMNCLPVHRQLQQVGLAMALKAGEGLLVELKDALPGTAYSWLSSVFSHTLSSAHTWFLLLLPCSCGHTTCISFLAGFVAKQLELQAWLWAYAGAGGCSGGNPGGLPPPCDSFCYQAEQKCCCREQWVIPNRHLLSR